MAFRAVFLDRDGVLNKKREDYVKSVAELQVLPAAGRHLARLQDRGFKLVIVTNQSAVNRGIISMDILESINSALIASLAESGCRVDAVYVCPHRPDESCQCRKPQAGLLLKAAEEMNIDLPRSWMLGDSESDMQACANAGCKGLKIKVNSDLSNAVNRILAEEGK